MLQLSGKSTAQVVLGEEICRVVIAGTGVDGAGISLRTETPAREILCASDPTIRLIEELQYTLGEGPCVEAARTGSPVLLPSFRAAEDASGWPVFAAALLEQSTVGALFAVPSQVGAIRLGVLDLYRAAPGALTEEQLRELIAAADVAALILLRVYIDPGSGHDWNHMSPSHAEVHQATGMLIAQLDVSAEDAFTCLRAHAFAESRLLRDVARDVVNRALRFDQDGTTR